ncbi:uncharacterized protein LY89DRAFT_773481 [Mollisia scopiformis]|uniref:Uncharacterized protein n=1 Tax=Mollisia scopiformis TaxID=149040 RepID=A0A194XHQ3_MOLSC|nr:uncharacterized protein LY89DRAFT_773481 [Mollisia scopiformis]KUJ19302.1 hypothetical protein LY89DRAFT_773481 [Mollisia scopiformis]
MVAGRGIEIGLEIGLCWWFGLMRGILVDWFLRSQIASGIIDSYLKHQIPKGINCNGPPLAGEVSVESIDTWVARPRASFHLIERRDEARIPTWIRFNVEIQKGFLFAHFVCAILIARTSFSRFKNLDETSFLGLLNAQKCKAQLISAMVEGVRDAVYLDDGHLEEAVVWACWKGEERVMERRSNTLGLLRPEDVEAQQLGEYDGGITAAKDFKMESDIVLMLGIGEVLCLYLCLCLCLDNAFD